MIHWPYDPADIDAVVFDIGGVFAVRDPELIRTGMANGGFTLPGEAETFVRAHYEGVAALAAAMPNHTKDGHLDEYDPAFWRNYEIAYLTALGVVSERIDEALQAMKTEVFEKLSPPIWRHLLDDNIRGFHRLIDAGVPVAIVSNNDGSAERQMLDFGICQVGPGPLRAVAAIVDSGVVKVAKPNPAIFQPALDALRTPAFKTLYVGDTFHADVVGARNAGMPVVQLDPYGLHAGFDHARMSGVSSLADALLGPIAI